jgi:hypothetical protein
MNQQPGEIILWETLTWQSCLTLTRKDNHEFLGVGFADGGRTLYAAANRLEPNSTRPPPGELIRWDTRGNLGETVRTPGPLTKPKQLAGTILRSDTRASILQMAGYEAIAIHPAGRLVAAVTVRCQLVLWDVDKGEVVREVLSQVDFQLPIGRLTFSADGQRLLFVGRNSANVYSVPELKLVQQRVQRPFTHLVAAGVSIGENPLVTLEIQEPRFEPRLVTASKSLLLDIPAVGVGSFSADARYLFVVGQAPASARREVRLVSVPDGKVLFTAEHTDYVRACGFSGDGKTCYVITVSDADTKKAPRLQRWSVPTGAKLETLAGVTYPYTVSPDLRHGLTRTNAANIYAIDLGTGQQVPQPVAVQALVRGMAFFPDGRHFATFGNQAQVHIWDLTKSVLPAPATPELAPIETQPIAPRIAFERSLAKARAQLLGDFDATLAQLEKQVAAGQKLSVSPELVKNEKASFEKDGFVPWSEPMRPFLANYLQSLLAARAQMQAAYIPNQDATVIARWKHEPGGAVNRFYSNGKINDPPGNNTWSFANGKLILRWQDRKAKGGFWVDTCNVSADGLSYSGTNQINIRISGILVND